MDSFPLFIALAAATFVLAGFVKGIIGAGLPTVAVGLLSLVMSPAEAVALMLGPALLTNIWQGFAGSGTAAILRRLWPTLIGLCVGTWVASMIGFGLTPEAANRARVTLGITLAAYAGIGLADIRFTLRAEAEQWLGPLVGLATGVLSAATGVFMIPAVPYYQAIGYSNEELVRVQGISYTVSTLALVALLSSNGVLQTANASMSALAVVPALAGMALGQRVRRLVSPKTFRLCFYLGMLALGAHLALIHR